MTVRALVSSNGLWCVLLAAGGSRRLGYPKQLLRDPVRPMILRAVDAAESVTPGRVLVVLGAHSLRLRALLARNYRNLSIVKNTNWRDGIASGRDKAPFRIAGDQALLEAVVRRPGTTGQLAEVRGFSRALASQEGRDLLERMARVALLPEEEIVPYPRRARTGPGRPAPEAEERAVRLKEVRNRRADELGIARGTLLPNAVLFEIARREPRSPDELDAVPELRHWQAEALGEALLATLNKRRVSAR